jgi:signal transduction histidine kinase
MPAAAIPQNEELRLKDLYAHDILDSESEKEFNDLLEIAALIYGCPIAAITFIDKERQWLKAKRGIDNDLSETPRDIAFCAHTILQNEVVVVKDATQDERFWDNPVVTGGLFIRFYAAAPIVSNTGYKLGAVCVIDDKPRTLGKEETRTLSIISQQISKLLELRLKNKVLMHRTEEQLRLEKLLLQKTLEEHEQERFYIGTELHENIAQGLAATRFYLELAEAGTVAKDDLIRRCKNNVTELVRQVVELSKSVTPTTFKDANLEELFKELISQFYNRTGIETHFVFKGGKIVSHDVTIALYRTVEWFLKSIKGQAAITVVALTIDVTKSVRLTMKDDRCCISEADKTQMGINKILSWVEHLKGQATFTQGVKSGCELVVTLPLHQYAKAL